MLWCWDLFQAFSCFLFHSSCCSSTSAGLNRLDQNVYLPKLIQRCLDNKCHKKVQKSRNWKGVFWAHWNCIRFVGGQKGWDTDGIEKELTFEPPRQHWLNRSEVRICHNAQMLQMRKFASVPFKPIKHLLHQKHNDIDHNIIHSLGENVVWIVMMGTDLLTLRIEGGCVKREQIFPKGDERTMWRKYLP